MAPRTRSVAQPDVAALPLPADGRRRVVISGFSPEVDGGLHPAKRVAGEPVVVEADVFADGHDEIAAVLLYRAPGEREWTEAPLEALGNDRFRGSFTPQLPGLHEVAIEGFIDRFGSWSRDLRKRHDARQDVEIELLAGAALLRERAAHANAAGESAAARRLIRDAEEMERASPGAVARALDDELAAIARAHDPRDHAVRLEPARLIDVDRRLARDGAWYELFPRSCSPEPGRHGTLKDVEMLLPRLQRLGFDVLYLPPIHPIGVTHRKGRDNAVTCEPGDVGSPWAIGSAEGGHEAVHPQLGTVQDVRRLASEARRHGIELALDLALQCSPDHPWVREHPDWFRHRPDGSIRHAENPPKKYEDIYPLDFECEDWPSLWKACLGIVLHWMEQGVSIFRVDNPHGKPLRFWRWLIRSARERDPGAIFLSEAFTRPRIMEHLAKAGFSQSYTYFTWRNSKAELQAYVTELNAAPLRDFFRPSFWPNTPDILHATLQEGGRPAFVQRMVLAATLASTWGVYGPPLEACEAAPAKPGSEEYLHSEKYELRTWQPDGPGSTAPLMALLNGIRRTEPAMRGSASLRFLPCSDDAILCWARTLPGAAPILAVASLDPRGVRSGWVDVDPALLGLPPGEPFRVVDLLGDGAWEWRPGSNYVSLDPQRMPAHVFRVEPLATPTESP